MKELLDNIISSLKNNGFDFNMDSKLSSLKSATQRPK